MRRFALCLIIALLATPGAFHPTEAQQRPAPPPHAWLFGSWTGGLFPVPANMTKQMCLAQPVVIFTRDLVLRSSLIDSTYQQRSIETARSNPAGAEIRFAPGTRALDSLNSGLLGQTAPPAPAGFGCENPDVLHIQRRSDNEISFPGCADFPEPLVRCP
jgi:hypothetical protein